MSDLRSKLVIVIKGILFLVLLVLACGLLMVSLPEWRTVALLAVVIWSAARLYYFLFYVLEHHVDPSLRYSGLIALVRELRNRAGRGRR